ncbi:Chemotaxis response regulator protein-glutamate methylesterase [Candidatus Bealeia paramacronuclearis]|uniref:Protein-glutamate methylesterase/protein-glutamine glutaminase n=1 Tax=Candidatus Bealeia paramacronuclearis TaxID=1921001 RepID=A0ABZ2C2D5_9PROT|nr:Chemotaxis response regulator protein-glutamate methylesterase [Candidatus Bealeia paramacronuclearis]
MALNAPTSQTQNKTRVMVVDDSLVIRGVLRRVIESDPDLELTKTVCNGQEAVDALAKDSSVDVVILDIEMPVMDGIETLPLLLKIKPKLIIIMASTLTLRNADISLKCLSLGAKDYIAKPESSTGGGAIEIFKKDLIARIKALSPQKYFSNAGRSQFSIPAKDYTLKPMLKLKPRAIAIGCSTGGPQALAVVLKDLASKVTLPIFIAQHMPPSFTKMLAEHLARVSGLTVKEGEDGEVVQDKTIYIAPGNFHMEVIELSGDVRICLTQSPPENFCRPSVNPLFRSLSKTYHGRVLGFILTGMGSDGLEGAKVLVQEGGAIIAQDEKTSTVWGMPKAVVMSDLASAVLPLEKLNSALEKLSKSLTPSFEVLT